MYDQQLTAETPRNANALTRLALSTDAGTRHAVAGNPHTPSHVLESLSTDDDENVRTNVAANPRTEPFVLCNLMQDECKMVRLNVAGNPNTHPDELRWICKNETSPTVLLAAIQNPKTPALAVLDLKYHRHRSVRAAAKKMESIW